MNYKKLGNSNLNISTISMGTMTWGEQNTLEEAFEQMDYAYDQGVNIFDSAELYPVPPSADTQGETSRILGQWVKSRKIRDKVIIADKIVGRSGMNWFRPEGIETRLDKKQIEFALDRTLKNLEMDYVDIYQLHWPDRPINVFGGLEYEHTDSRDAISIEETLTALDELVKQGKIRHIGLSNETAWGTSEFLKVASQKKLSKIISIQNPYNLLNRSFEVGLSEISIREQVGLLAYSPLASGVLTGKYFDGKLPKGSRMDLFGHRYPRYKTLNAEAAAKKYHAVASKHGLNPCQMAIKFCEIQKFVSSVIIGQTTMEQLKTNIGSISLNLSKEVIKDINEVQIIYSNPCP
ncbi:aldo/keto reductase [Pelagibacteraceae bacterium]|nr:aldo/keto reductase [Pelagibacteraceae bacterium]